MTPAKHNASTVMPRARHDRTEAETQNGVCGENRSVIVDVSTTVDSETSLQDGAQEGSLAVLCGINFRRSAEHEIDTWEAMHYQVARVATQLRWFHIPRPNQEEVDVAG